MTFLFVQVDLDHTGNVTEFGDPPYCGYEFLNVTFSAKCVFLNVLVIVGNKRLCPRFYFFCAFIHFWACCNAGAPMMRLFDDMII